MKINKNRKALRFRFNPNGNANDAYIIKIIVPAVLDVPISVAPKLYSSSYQTIFPNNFNVIILKFNFFKIFEYIIKKTHNLISNQNTKSKQCNKSLT